MRKKDNLAYNASHAPDPTAKKAIEAVDEQPEKVSDAIKIIKAFLRMLGLEIVGRIKIKDKETGRIWS